MIEPPSPSIIFFSPNGTTRDVAGWFAEEMLAARLKPEQIDLTKRTASEVREIAATVTSGKCFLVVGTPVYVGHPPRSIMDFLRYLPVQQDGSAAILYAMYGGVTCGSALKYMATILHKRNVRVIAAAKLVAKHSMMLDRSRDRFADHPSANEKALVVELVNRITAWHSAANSRMDPGVFQYTTLPPRSLLGKLVAKVSSTKLISPPKHGASRCTSCGKCIESCSTQCLTLVSGNKIIRGKDCVKCFNCLRACPNNAWKSTFLVAFPRYYESHANKKPELMASIIFKENSASDLS
jgi:ferredoxin/NAD(P)H-dependent FMN reductase